MKLEAKAGLITCRIEKENFSKQFYLHVFEDDQFVSSELKTSLLDCQQAALELCGIPLSGWQEVPGT